MTTMFKVNVNVRKVLWKIHVAFKVNICLIEAVQRNIINRNVKTSIFPVIIDLDFLLIATKFQFNFIVFKTTFLINYLLTNSESSNRFWNITLKADNPETYLILLQIKLSFIKQVKEYCLCGFHLPALILVAQCQNNRVYKYEHSD